ncbi:efflux RND transporter periplasmic adaptor subunit [Candidatus Babeliales bacterium]|nr:efflux RND transporter periplasmic adaptor subunit [Candidatus Babeliales bacterium]
MNKKIIIITVLIVFATGTIARIFLSKKKEDLVLASEKPQRRHLAQFVTASGMLKAKDQFTVGSLVAGKIIKILVDNNDHVKKDQVIAILDNGIGDTDVKKLTAQLKEAQANLAYQENFFKRQKELYQSSQLAKNKFEQEERDFLVSQARVKQLKASLEREQKLYGNLFIKSPDNGTIIAKKVDVGQQITSQFDATVLFIIAKDLTDMEAYVDVDEADIGLIKEKQEAVFTVDTFTKRPFVSLVKQVQFQSKTVENVITFATVLQVSNPTIELRPGMTTNVEIKVGEDKNALSISNKALRISGFKLEEFAKKSGYTFEKLELKPGSIKQQQHDTLWILEDKTIKQVEVTLGVVDTRFTQVIKGLTESSNVIVEFTEQQRENMLLRAVYGARPGMIGTK